MIASSLRAASTGLSFRQGDAGPQRTAADAPPCCPRACPERGCNVAPRPDARRLAGGLQAPLRNGAANAGRALAAAEAARGFATGNGFLPGQMLDRSA